MNKDRGQIDQGSSGSTGLGSSGQSGTYDFNQPAWDVPRNQIAEQVSSLDSFVIIGTKQGKPFVASTDGKMQAQQLLKQHATDLLPQNA